MIRRLITGILFSSVCAGTLVACNTAPSTSPATGIITNKVQENEEYSTDYRVWVEYKSADDVDIVKYSVREDYYNSCKIGDKFDDKYAIGEGQTEVDVRM